ALSHHPQADAGREGIQIALAWFFGRSDGIYAHDGASLGHTSDAFFDPAHDTAVIVFSNVSGLTALSAGLVGNHLRARLTGKPAVAIEEITIPARPGGSAGSRDGSGPLLGGLLGVARLFAAYWITMLAAGAFVFCAVMCVQGLAAQTLPRRQFLRVSSFLQLGAFALFVGVYCLQAISPDLIGAQRGGLFSSLPTYWFLALFQALSGSPAMAPLVRSAWLGLAVVVVVAMTMYALSY